jgi:hypothetical protein
MGLAPLKAGAESLKEDGDDASDESEAIHTCLHWIDLRVIFRLPPGEPFQSELSDTHTLGLSNSTFVGVCPSLPRPMTGES